MKESQSYCGILLIIGRSNVGKSTLFNRLLGKKLSIITSKPHTTRHCILGIHTEGMYQAVYMDTPGLHINGEEKCNSLIKNNIYDYLNYVNLIIFIVEGTRWMQNDIMIVNKLRNINIPVLLVVNKIDHIYDRSFLLPHLKFLSQQMNFIEIIPISAKTGVNIDLLIKIVRKYLPKANHKFPKEYLTDRSNYFIVSEIIREKLMRFLGAELPYSINVEIEQFLIKKNDSCHIYALIVVDQLSQKKIVIGKKGKKIKIIGTEARKDIEEIFKKTIYLTLWVKVKSKFIDIDKYLQC
ncbi:GTPase Era [Pantoea sp. Mhis]|uniref:GTPase Era n=1 Tax=Pantoea sp. Mhis TaxID=2576759 RepID=UPI00135BA58F|nr:GTPase Era [Pantoea sp. Mhis]MXP56608.1 GTPase Era [Pantoea sp. Mhis]